jgi:hypothetical protein
MKDRAECRRAEELFSDEMEGRLDDVLRADLHAHLASCESCRALRAALAEVVGALRGVSVPEPAPALAERAAALALRRARRFPTVPAIPFWLQAAAAVVAVATTAGPLFLARTGVEPAAAASRLRAQTAQAGAYLQEKTDRLLEDVRLLRVVITTAFEGRLERVNDRVDDYRRLMERRRNSEGEHKKSRVDAAADRRLAAAAQPQDVLHRVPQVVPCVASYEAGDSRLRPSPADRISRTRTVEVS